MQKLQNFGVDESFLPHFENEFEIRPAVQHREDHWYILKSLVKYGVWEAAEIRSAPVVESDTIAEWPACNYAKDTLDFVSEINSQSCLFPVLISGGQFNIRLNERMPS